MAARPVSAGTISFGLVSIPVKLFSTNESSSGISFNMLHKTCHSRLKQQLICPKDNEIVARSDSVKGYEFAKDQYVVLSEEELEAIEVATTKAIEITEFVPADAVDPLYFDTAYYVAPDKGGDRAYRLLSEAMRQSGLHAIAKHATRGKEYLVLVRPFEKGLLLQQLRYAQEVKSIDEVPLPDAEVRPAELALAMQFVQQLKTDAFDPEKYKDDVKEKVHALIQKKIEGESITVQAEAPRAQIIDLMDALRASLGQSGGATDAPAESDKKPAKRAGGKK